MSARKILHARAAAVAGCALIVGGCAAGADAARGVGRQVAEAVDGRCHDDHPDTLVLLDGSTSGAGLGDLQLDFVGSVAEDVAARCGTLTVGIFGSTSSDYAEILQAEDLTPDGSHDGARADNRADEVDDVVTAVSEALDAHAPSEGTATIGAIASAARVLAPEVGDGSAELYVVGDGLETEAFEMRKLVNDGAGVGDLLALAPEPPDLRGVEVTVVGVGIVAGDAKPTAITETAVRFYQEFLCEAEPAPASCLVLDRFSKGVIAR